MTPPKTPDHWANTLTQILDVTCGNETQRFPIDVPSLAKMYSEQRYPEDPITLVKGRDLDDFEGALMRAPSGKKGWGIVYNNELGSPGRINFTLAHEFGHYLLHRKKYPNGIQCSEEDMVRWDSEYGKMEHEANRFAACLLMPLNDFRKQISPNTKPNISTLSQCADRYGVSLIAATLRWLEFTERRAVLVISRDGFILWARSSESALKSGAYFKTSGRSPIEVPEQSLMMTLDIDPGHDTNANHPPGVWLKEACEEHALVSSQYDLAFSLLHLPEKQRYDDFENEEEETVSERIQRLHGLR
ncbi:ImmA/IrrE family metallo-endopeptidase [Thalassospira tepidiphila]|uniref:ImmA/IrrE family metallo-endopeptidase n=1 Tax=Thalassospira tepidiphila TaxID=393657 RepID=UPI0029201F97|nr:hypothetical protein MACH01_37570 [Thalassospira tepidiphila]